MHSRIRPVPLIAHVMIVAALWLASGISRATPKTAEIPYARVYELLYQFESLPAADRDHLAFHVRLKSREPSGVPVEAFIPWRDEQLPVSIEPEFGFMSFPFSPQLRQENPNIITNQPIGTLALGLAIEILPPLAGAPDATWWLTAIDQAHRAIRKQSRRGPENTPAVRGISVMTEPGEKLEIILHSPEGDQALQSDERSVIHISVAQLQDAERITINGHIRIVFPWIGNGNRSL